MEKEKLIEMRANGKREAKGEAVVSAEGLLHGQTMRDVTDKLRFGAR